ncbi:uncharacterized protein LOC104449615 [Eucalyptus grandis]|uniref:uncharacterized protein LOC104449615 n=1 Tax=Eucalyptus grandis TaxID=71139 RepID=UPI00192EB839|nr:uncharacterized protein LOC104449615 [Eucalyptus grandis]
MRRLPRPAPRTAEDPPAPPGPTSARGMVTVCLECGDNGFDVALIYCGDCQECAIHLYCLETLPKTFDEHVVWFCEDCRHKLGKPNTNEESCSSLCEEDDLETIEFVQCTKNSKSFPIERLGKKIEIEKWMREKKRRKKNELKPLMVRDKEGQLAEKGRVFTSETDVGKTKYVCLSQVYGTRSSGNYEKADNIGIDMRATLGDMRNSNEEAESMKALESPKLDCPKLFGERTYSYAQPIIDPIWRGSLKFNKQGINYFGKVVAHVSDLACSKVNKEAKLFPSILCTELHPTPKVWPKGFKDRGPSDDSIAIYIFPDNKSEQEFFDSLVIEMIRNDLAMRVVVTNAEFLVFTSTKLPLHLWRFQSKFYLWGVFREPLPVSKVDVDTPGSVKGPLKRISWKMHSPGSPLSISGSDGSSTVY